MERHRGFWVDNSRNSSPDLLHASANAGHAPNPPPGFQATKEPGRDLSGQHFGLWRQHDPSGSPSRVLVPGQGLKNAAKLWPVRDSGAQARGRKPVCSAAACACQASGLTLGGRNAQLPENEMLTFKFTADLQRHMAHADDTQPKRALITRLSPPPHPPTPARL